MIYKGGWYDANDNLKRVFGDIATECEHKGRHLIFFGDGEIAGEKFTCIMGEVIDRENGICALQPRNCAENVYGVSSVPQKAISIDGVLYLWLLHTVDWSTPLPQHEARGILNVSKDDGKTWKEVWFGDMSGGIHEETAPYVTTTPVQDNRDPNKIWIFSTEAFRRGGIILAVTHKKYLSNPDRYRQLGLINPIIVDAHTVDYSVGYDPVAKQWLCGYWQFRQPLGGERALYFTHADSPDGKWSEPVKVWDGDCKCDWYEFNTPDILKDKEKFMIMFNKLAVTKPRLYEKIDNAFELGGWFAVEKLLGRSWGTPYAFEMGDLSGRTIPANVSLWVPYSAFRVEFDREDVYR